MGNLAWRDSATATAPPRVRVVRFCSPSSMSRIQLLAELQCLVTHKKDGENTVPCSKPEPCVWCEQVLYKPRNEHFAPALLLNRRDMIWEPIVAVLTEGAWKILAKKSRPHTGLQIDLWRKKGGNLFRLLLEVVDRVVPLIPPFDIEPSLRAMWFPQEEHPATDLPAAVPYTRPANGPGCVEVAPLRLSAETRSMMRQSPEELAKIKELLAADRAKRQGPAAPPIDEAPPANDSPVPPSVGEPRPAEEPAELDVIKMSQQRERYGPRQPVQRGLVPAGDAVAAALARRRVNGGGT